MFCSAPRLTPSICYSVKTRFLVKKLFDNFGIGYRSTLCHQVYRWWYFEQQWWILAPGCWSPFPILLCPLYIYTTLWVVSRNVNVLIIVASLLSCSHKRWWCTFFAYRYQHRLSKWLVGLTVICNLQQDTVSGFPSASTFLHLKGVEWYVCEREMKKKNTEGVWKNGEKVVNILSQNLYIW